MEFGIPKHQADGLVERYISNPSVIQLSFRR